MTVFQIFFPYSVWRLILLRSLISHNSSLSSKFAKFSRTSVSLVLSLDFSAWQLGRIFVTIPICFSHGLRRRNWSLQNGHSQQVLAAPVVSLPRKTCRGR